MKEGISKISCLLFYDFTSINILVFNDIHTYAYNIFDDMDELLGVCYNYL